jgi:hypothetical protein
VLPAIKRGALPVAGSSQWPCLVVTPSADPLLALATAVGAVTGEGPQDLRDAWDRDPTRCVRDLRRMPAVAELRGPAVPTRVVLVVDPLEDLFTACEDKGRQRRFIDVLDRVSGLGDDGEESAALVIVGVRADYYQHSRTSRVSGTRWVLRCR